MNNGECSAQVNMCPEKKLKSEMEGRERRAEGGRGGWREGGRGRGETHHKE
jgi:hypothetical protein